MTRSVSGIASTKIKTDKIVLSLGIETTNKTANAALNANSKLMNKVLTVLKSEGVKENEISNSSFNISPNYNYSHTNNNSSDTQGSITGFRVTNSIQTVNNFGGLGDGKAVVFFDDAVKNRRH